jgi:oxalate decarboxylase/phosphoglucose isomerase-like protein (cupin superfamily)
VKRLATETLRRAVAHGGEGEIGVARLFRRTEFRAPISFVDYAVLPPGTSIGEHRHGENEEIYLVLDGEGEMTLDESRFPVGPGAVVLNRAGGLHGLRNTGAVDLKIFVVEVRLPGSDVDPEDRAR